MNSPSAIAKRFLNIAFIGCILWSAFVAIIGVTCAFASGKVNWSGWFTHGVLTAIAGYVALAVISYIFFGRVTFWYKSAT